MFPLPIYIRTLEVAMGFSNFSLEIKLFSFTSLVDEI